MKVKNLLKEIIINYEFSYCETCERETRKILKFYDYEKKLSCSVCESIYD